MSWSSSYIVSIIVMFCFTICSEILCEYERDSRLRSKCIICPYFTLNVLGARLAPLCIEMYMNEDKINERSMKHIGLCILWILIWMYVYYTVLCATRIWMLWLNVKWMHGCEMDVSYLYCSFMIWEKPTIFVIFVVSRVRPSLVLEDWICWHLWTICW